MNTNNNNKEESCDIEVLPNIVYDKEETFPIFLNEKDKKQCYLTSQLIFNGITLKQNESLIDQNILPETFLYLIPNISSQPLNIAVYSSCTIGN